MGHTELLGLLPRLLGRRKVIQAPTVELPALQEQLEKLIWSKGGEGENRELAADPAPSRD